MTYLILAGVNKSQCSSNFPSQAGDSSCDLFIFQLEVTIHLFKGHVKSQFHKNTHTKDLPGFFNLFLHFQPRSKKNPEGWVMFSLTNSPKKTGSFVSRIFPQRKRWVASTKAPYHCHLGCSLNRWRCVDEG